MVACSTGTLTVLAWFWFEETGDSESLMAWVLAIRHRNPKNQSLKHGCPGRLGNNSITNCRLDDRRRNNPVNRSRDYFGSCRGA